MKGSLMKMKNYYKNLSKYPKRSSNEAIGLIEQCLHPNDKYKHDHCKYNDHKVIKQIIAIYHSVTHQRNHSLFNQMLRAHLHFKHSPQSIKLLDVLWNDIQILFSSNLNHALLLKAICNNNDIDKLIQTLEWIEQSESNCFAYSQSPINKILSMLIEHGYKQKAMHIFNSLDDNDKSEHMIASMMKLHLQNNENESALTLYDKYHDRDNGIIHLFAIKACGNTLNHQKGKEIHNKIESKLTDNIKLKNALIHFYGKCDDLSAAKKLFESISNKQMNAQSIGCMMQMYAEHELYNQALEIYDNYDSLKDDISHLLAIKACSKSDNFEKGKQIHQRINVVNVQLITSLIEFYGSFDDLQSAMHLFESVESKNIICIGAMMKAYLNCAEYTKCIRLFEDI